MKDVKELLKGGYDLHVHSAPDCLPRKMDDVDMGERITKISHEEAYKLVPEASKRGVKKIVITHVSFPTTYYSIEDQKMFISYGAKCEHCYTTWKTGKEEFDVIADMIKAVGAENCIIGTDLGNTKLCFPDEGMEEFAEKLLEAGLSEDDVRMMAVTNPRWLLGKDSME